MDDLVRVMAALRPEVAIEGWRGTARYEPQAEHRGNEGWLHGGMAAYLLDHVCARTAAAALGEWVVTARLTLRYRQPVALADGPYEVTATAAEPRRRTVRVTAAIFSAGGGGDKPLVEAEGLFAVRPAALGNGG